VKRIVVLGIPHKQPVLVAREEFPLHPLGHPLGALSFARNFDAFDLALDRSHGLGAGRGEEGMKVGHARHGRLLVVKVYPRGGGEELIPVIEEAFLKGRRVEFVDCASRAVVGNIGFE